MCLSLKPPDPVSLSLFKNGIVMFDGPFRPYTELSTQVSHEGLPLFISKLSVQIDAPKYDWLFPRRVPLQQCICDLTDGYFPSELQHRFPDGVPFAVSEE